MRTYLTRRPCARRRRTDADNRQLQHICAGSTHTQSLTTNRSRVGDVTRFSARRYFQRQVCVRLVGGADTLTVFAGHLQICTLKNVYNITTNRIPYLRLHLKTKFIIDGFRLFERFNRRFQQLILLMQSIEYRME
jgi:hypothetical protein